MCFDIDRFVDQNLASKLVCSICQGVLCCPQSNKPSPISKQEPANGKKGGHKYCEKCIRNWLQKEKSCPECREQLNTSTLQDLDRFSLEILKELKTRCQFANKGCKFVDKLELIERHELNDCLYGPKACKTCGALVHSTMIHSDKDCIHRLIKIIKMKDEENRQRNATFDALSNHFKHELKIRDEKIRKLMNEVNKLNDVVEKLKHNNEKDKAVKKKNEGIPPRGFFTPKTVVDLPELVVICNSKENPYNRVKAIVELQKANVNYKDEHGYTALINASRNGHVNLVQFLIQNGANVNDQEYYYGYTALNLVSGIGNLNLVTLLIQNGANVNLSTSDGYSCLMNASNRGHLEIVKVLVENGAVLNIKDRNNKTALGYAKNEDVKQYLISLGAV